MISDATSSIIFSIFDANMASTRPGTYLERCASKFCVEWWSDDLHSSRMDLIGGKNQVPGSRFAISWMFDAKVASNALGLI